jgi:hypothetical protein
MYVMAGFAALQAILCALPIVDRVYKRIESWYEAIEARELKEQERKPRVELEPVVALGGVGEEESEQ